MSDAPKTARSTGCAFPLVLLATHLAGSASLGLFALGIQGLLGFPLLAIFGWFFIIPEAAALGVLWYAYEPSDRRRFVLGLITATLIGAAIMATIGIGEIGSELKWRLANGLAGATVAATAFVLAHYAKVASLRASEGEIVSYFGFGVSRSVYQRFVAASPVFDICLVEARLRPANVSRTSHAP